MKGTLISYVSGFILSIALTLAAFFVVIRPAFLHFDGGAVLTAILILALVQLVVQLVLFLHIGKESGPRWQLITFVFTFALVLILVVASLWIMTRLNYNMTPMQVDQYMQAQQGGF